LRFQGYIFDLDGTVYVGDTLLPRVKKTIEQLRGRGRQVLFLSNKPIQNRRDYADKLTRLGIPTPESSVINSSFVAALYFKKVMPSARIFVIGESALKDELLSAGLKMSVTPEETDVVLVSLDRDLSYEKIHFAYHAAKTGAKTWATNPDLVCPMPNDEIIDAGATIAALEALLRRPIDGVIGKPSPIMIDTVLGHLQLPPDQCLMVGDRLETDIVMGKSAGMSTALVLTGVTKRADIGLLGIHPDYILESVDGVLSL
jgi:NagD protein